MINDIVYAYRRLDNLLKNKKVTRFEFLIYVILRNVKLLRLIFLDRYDRLFFEQGYRLWFYDFDDYEDHLFCLVGLSGSVQSYLDKVQVFCKNRIRKIFRINLLREVKSNYSWYCDWNKIRVEEEE